MIQGFVVGRNKVEVSHLQFVGNTLFIRGLVVGRDKVEVSHLQFLIGCFLWMQIIVVL